MATTLNYGWEKPADREQFLEILLQQILDDIDADVYAGGRADVSGLKLSWVSASSVSVGTGAASLPSGGLLSVTAAITVSGIALGASAWGHAYLYSNAGVAAVEVVTTAPALYFGTAYQKTADATRRYLGSVRTDAAGNVINFLHVMPNTIRYRNNVIGSPNRVLSAGAATASTSVSAATVAPVTSRLLWARLTNTHATVNTLFGSSDGLTPTAAQGSELISAAKEKDAPLPLDAAQAFLYINDAAGGSTYVDTLGYVFER